MTTHTHYELLGLPSGCGGALEPLGDVFTDKAIWRKFFCTDCGRIVYALRGELHPANFDRPADQREGVVALT